MENNKALKIMKMKKTQQEMQEKKVRMIEMRKGMIKGKWIVKGLNQHKRVMHHKADNRKGDIP